MNDAQRREYRTRGLEAIKQHDVEKFNHLYKKSGQLSEDFLVNAIETGDPKIIKTVFNKNQNYWLDRLDTWTATSKNEDYLGLFLKTAENNNRWQGFSKAAYFEWANPRPSHKESRKNLLRHVKENPKLERIIRKNIPVKIMIDLVAASIHDTQEKPNLDWLEVLTRTHRDRFEHAQVTQCNFTLAASKDHSYLIFEHPWKKSITDESWILGTASLLTIALKENRLDLAEQLLGAGYKIDQVGTEAHIGSRAMGGYDFEILKSIVANVPTTSIQWLIDKGASPTGEQFWLTSDGAVKLQSRINPQKNIALAAALIKNNQETVDLLLKNGCSIEWLIQEMEQKNAKDQKPFVSQSPPPITLYQTHPPLVKQIEAQLLKRSFYRTDPKATSRLKPTAKAL